MITRSSEEDSPNWLTNIFNLPLSPAVRLVFTNAYMLKVFSRD